MDQTQGQLGSENADARDGRRRVLIAIPIFTHVEPEPFAQFCALMLRAGQDCHRTHVLDILTPARQLLHGAMNQVAQTVLEHDHDGMIVMDDDCLPPFDAIPRLLGHAAQGHDIVAGVGLMRGFPHTTTVGRYYKEGHSLVRRKDGHYEWRGFGWLDDLTKLPRGLNEVDFCGMPIIWISRKVLAAIDPPWFGTHLDGGDMTHDVYFATKAQRAGFKIRVDTTIECGHLVAAKVVDFKNRAEVRAMHIAADAIRQTGTVDRAAVYLETLAKAVTEPA